MFGWLKKKETPIEKPAIPDLGLEIGSSLEIETLNFKILMDKLTIEGIDESFIIKNAGKVELDGTTLYRFYMQETDAWIQVVCEGEPKEENIKDVVLFYYYDTHNIVNQAAWDKLLNEQIGNPTYRIDDKEFNIVWGSTGEYSPPVHMHETCYDHTDEPSETDQFGMLFERVVDEDSGLNELLFLSAEEVVNDSGNLERCFVLSTGIPLNPAQLKLS